MERITIIKPPFSWRIRRKLRSLRIKIFGKTKRDLEVDKTIQSINDWMLTSFAVDPVIPDSSDPKT